MTTHSGAELLGVTEDMPADILKIITPYVTAVDILLDLMSSADPERCKAYLMALTDTLAAGKCAVVAYTS